MDCVLAELDIEEQMKVLLQQLSEKPLLTFHRYSGDKTAKAWW